MPPPANTSGSGRSNNKSEKPISTTGLKARKELFHDEWITVYPTEMPLAKIRYWPENDRTKFTFERLEKEQRKPLSKLSLEEIIDYVARLPIHGLDKLSRSIERNGVRVPLIVLDDRTLLDGNRRFFASHLLRNRKFKAKDVEPEVLKRIPVWIIKASALSAKQQMKILAEANFVPDLKVPWPDGAKAKTVQRYFEDCVGSRKMDRDHAVSEIAEVFAINPQRVNEWLETLSIADEFVKEATSERDTYSRRQAVEERFVYFWEFRNKAMKGSSRLEDDELPEVKDMFFKLMGKEDGIQNIKQVEPLIRARRDEEAWGMLKESKGTKLKQVVALINEARAVQAAEDKVRQFHSWLKKLPKEEVTPGVLERLESMVETCRQRFGIGGRL